MATTEAQITALLQAKDLRATSYRKAVARVIHAAKGPIGAKEIYAKLLRGDAKMSFATVYRTLGALEKAGIVQRQPHVTGNTTYYQLPRQAKGQIVCSNCGKVEEIDLQPELVKLQASLSRKSRFAKPDNQSLYIISECRNKDDRSLCE